MEIIPAILPKSFDSLSEKLSLVRDLVPLVQVDVCDGQFVPSRSWPFVGNETGEYERIVHEEGGLPFWQELDFEAHLMVEGPEHYIDNWVSAGVSRVIVHQESTKDMPRLIAEFKRKYGIAADEFSPELGLALNMETPLDALDRYAADVNVFQLMGIDQSGYQGEPLDDMVIGRIGELRRKYPKHAISVDGGVNLENAPKLIMAGADRLVVGSAIFGSDNPRVALKHLKELLG